MKGIDISMHNGSVDLAKAKADGVEAVYIKATEGVSYVDPKCSEHTNKAKAQGLLFGHYHFMSEKTSPTQQAIDFYNTIKNTGYNLLPCLDIESNSQGRSAAAVTDRCLEFLNKFYELTGQRCVIYTGGYFGRDTLDSRIKGYPAWIAHYGVSTPMATGFNNVVGHQYTETGYIPGVGKCDVNNFTEGIKLYGAATVVNNVNPNYNAHLRDWQEAYNKVYNASIYVDGIYGSQTEQAFKKAIVKKGTSNLLVGWLQIRIGASPDNIFGDITNSKLRTFQSQNGLEPDGVAGFNTWSKLIEIYK